MQPDKAQQDVILKKLPPLLAAVSADMGIPVYASIFRPTFNDPLHEADLLHTEGLGEFRLYLGEHPWVHRELGNVVSQHAYEEFRDKLMHIAKRKKLPLFFDDEVPFLYAGCDDLSAMDKALDIMKRELGPPRSEQRAR